MFMLKVEEDEDPQSIRKFWNVMAEMDNNVIQWLKTILVLFVLFMNKNLKRLLNHFNDWLKYKPIDVDVSPSFYNFYYKFQHRLLTSKRIFKKSIDQFSSGAYGKAVVNLIIYCCCRLIIILFAYIPFVVVFTFILALSAAFFYVLVPILLLGWLFMKIIFIFMILLGFGLIYGLILIVVCILTLILTFLWVFITPLRLCAIIFIFCFKCLAVNVIQVCNDGCFIE